MGATQLPPEDFPVFFFLSGFEDSGFCAFEFCSTWQGLCDLGPPAEGLWARLPTRRMGEADRPSLAGRWREWNKLEHATSSEPGAQCLAHAARVGCYRYFRRDGLLPASIQEGFGTLPGVPREPLLQPQASQPAPAHSAILGGWHRTRREREASPRPRHQMGTIWAGGSGRAGSCRSGRAWQPLPRPGLAPRPPAPQVSQAARGGWGGLAGLQGWAGGFPLWAPVPPGSLPNTRQVEECRACPLLASPPASPGSHAAGLTVLNSPWRLSCSVPQAPGHAGLWAFALADWLCATPPAPCLLHSRKSLCGSLVSSRPHPKSHLLGASLPPHSSVWGFPPPCPSPHSLPALFSCPCSWSLNCKLSVFWSPTRLHTPLHPSSR